MYKRIKKIARRELRKFGLSNFEFRERGEENPRLLIYIKFNKIFSRSHLDKFFPSGEKKLQRNIVIWYDFEKKTFFTEINIWYDLNADRKRYKRYLYSKPKFESFYVNLEKITSFYYIISNVLVEEIKYEVSPFDLDNFNTKISFMIFKSLEFLFDKDKLKQLSFELYKIPKDTQSNYKMFSHYS